MRLDNARPLTLMAALPDAHLRSTQPAGFCKFSADTSRLSLSLQSGVFTISDPFVYLPTLPGRCE